MATGIVAAAMRDVGAEGLGRVLLALATAAFVVLVGGLGLRLVQAPRAVLGDLQESSHAWGFLTVVAAANVIGTDLHDFWPAVTGVLAMLSGVAWLLLAYGIPAWLVLRPDDAAVSRRYGVDGSWFLWVVSTQSLAVALATLASGGSHPRLVMLAVALWSIGLVLYLMLTSLAFARLLARSDRHAGVVPSNWIFMGATAITVLAGAEILAAPSTPVVSVTGPALAGMSFVLWAFGLWWVPLLVIFGVWRHALNHEPVRYTTGLWSIVFPLGMFSVSTLRFAELEHLPVMRDIGLGAAWLALAAWLAVAAGMATVLVHTLRDG